MRIERFNVANIIPLRAVLALAFIVLSSLQPGLFADANATGFHADNGITLSADTHDDHAADAGQNGHAAAVAADEVDHHSSSSAVAAGEADHRSSSTADNTGCEVHCVPLHGVAADCSPVLLPSVGCVPEVAVEVLQPAEHVEFVRPPRSLT